MALERFTTHYFDARLSEPMGQRGCLSPFVNRTELNRLFAEHLTADYRVKTEGRGRTVDEWKQRPERADNHWLDGVVGCAVAASIQGAVLAGTESRPMPKERLTLSELQRKARGGR